MNWNVFSFMQSPANQAMLFLLLTPLVILISRPKTADRAWVLALYPFILFLLVNAVFLWFQENPWRYFFYSIGSAVCYLVLIAIIMAGMLKLLKLKSSGESAMAFLILIYQPFALLFVMFVKWSASALF